MHSVHHLRPAPMQDSGDFAGYEEMLKGENEGFAGLELPLGLPNPFADGEASNGKTKKAGHLCALTLMADRDQASVLCDPDCLFLHAELVLPCLACHRSGSRGMAEPRLCADEEGRHAGAQAQAQEGCQERRRPAGRPLRRQEVSSDPQDIAASWFERNAAG